MKQLTEISGLFLILAIVLKLIDFNSPSVVDVIIMALFAIYAVLEIVTLAKRGKTYGREEKD